MRGHPHLEYLTYEECNDQFLRKLMPGLTPVWMTEDFDQVSTQVFDENGTFGELLKFYQGTICFTKTNWVSQNIFQNILS